MRDETGRPPVRVGIALIGRDGRYLVRQRLAGSDLAGRWEFPGGKCEPGESPAEATRRECFEEVGIEVVVGRCRREVSHHYPHARVELSFFDCSPRDAGAEPDPATGFRWVAARDLASLDFPEANGPIVEELAREAE
jgi:8-oxo-dGTP diphosphatase